MTLTLDELVYRRSQHSTCWRVLSDGQPTGALRSIIRARPVHFETAPGDRDWQPIDASLVDGGAAWRVDANDWRLRLAKTYSGPAPVRVIRRGGFDLGWKLAGLAHLSAGRTVTVLSPAVTAVAAERAGQVVTYPGVAGGGIDLRYTVSPHALKQDLVISQAALDALRGEIVAGGLGGGYLVVAYRLDLDSMAGWTVDLAAGSETASGVAIAGGALTRGWPAFGRPVATDGAGRLVDCLYRRVTHAQLGPALLVGVPLSWMAAATGPVVIDPTYLGETDDGYIYGANAVYSTARSTSSVADTGTSACYVGQAWASPVYYCYRSFVSFDTSAIGSDSVSAASIYVKANSDASATDFDIVVYRYAWVDTLSTNREANYDGAYGGSAVLEGTLRNTSAGWSTGTYYSRTVDAAGINTSGDSRYTLVSGRDTGNNTPTGNEYVGFYSANQAGTSDDPYLDVTHVPAGGNLAMRRLGHQPFRVVEIGRKSPGGVWAVALELSRLTRTLATV